MNRAKLTTLAGLTIAMLTTPSLSAVEDPFSPSWDLGDGWFYSAWFGNYYGAYKPWLYHLEHGWMYASAAPYGVWLYDARIRDWMLTSGQWYPNLYDQHEQGWLYYNRGGSGARWFMDGSTQEWFTFSCDGLLPADLDEGMDMMLGVSSLGGEVDEFSAEALGYVLLALIGDPSTSVCPVITRSPEVIDMENPPANIQASVQFGSGCIPDGSSEEMSGGVSVNITGITITDTGLSAQLSLVASELMRGDLLLMNGSLTASLAATLGETLSANGQVQFSNFDLAGTVVQGTVSLNISGIDVELFSGGTITLAFSNFVAGGETISGGNVVLTLAPDGSGVTMQANLTTSLGQFAGTMQMLEQADGSVLIDMANAAAFGAYTFQVNEVRLDPYACGPFPVGGNIVISDGSSTYTIQFTPRCNGVFRVTKS